MRVLFLSLICAAISAQMILPIQQYHYVDSAGGNDSNTGTQANPWLTLAHADAVLALNAPLKLRYPDGSWYLAPADWHGIVAFFPFVRGAGNFAYDVANGNNFAFAGGLTGANVFRWKYNGLQLANHLDYLTGPGDSVFSLGTTGNVSVVTTSVTNWAPAAGSALFGYGGHTTPGFGLLAWTTVPQFNVIATDTTLMQVAASSRPSTALHTVVGTFQRSSATGLNLYVDGVSAATPVSTVAFGAKTVTSGIAAGIGSLYRSGGWNDILSTDSLSRIIIYNRSLTSTEVAAVSAEANAAVIGFKYYAAGFWGGFSASFTMATLLSPDGIYCYSHPNTTDFGGTRGIGNPYVWKQDATHWWANVQDTQLPGGMTIASSPNGWDWTSIAHTSGYGGWYVSGPWFIDPADGTVHIVGVYAVAPEPAYVAGEIHPTSQDMTTWSSPATLSGIPSNQDLPVMVYLPLGFPSTPYCLVTSDNTSYLFGMWCSSSLLGTYTRVHADGWNSSAYGESPSLLQDSANPHHWKMWFVHNGGANAWLYYYMDSYDDCATWSTPVRIVEPVSNQGSTIGPNVAAMGVIRAITVP